MAIAIIDVKPKPKLTYEDYASLPDDERYELIDGELMPMPSPKEIHQRLILDLSWILRRLEEMGLATVPENGGRKIRREILIQLGNHSAPTQELPTMTRIRFIPAQVKTFPDERPRRLQALRQPNPHPALNLREVRDRPLRGESHGCPIPLLRLRERLQALPGGRRPLRTYPGGCAALAWTLGLSPRSASHPLPPSAYQYRA